MNIRTAIIPAAGYGTRFLPFTKAVPKEMLPLLNKPAIEYIVQEMYDCHLFNCLMIISPYKQALESYFTRSPHLENFLSEKNKLNLLDSVQRLIDGMTFTYIPQEQAKGLGHAIALARNSVHEEFVAILLPDDLIFNAQPAIGQLMAIARQENASIIAVQEVPLEAVSSYGILKVKQQISQDLFEIADVIEKPAPQDAPSNLAIIGRYILSCHIFKALDQVGPAAHGEIQLTDGIAHMIKAGHKVLGYKIQGTRYDIGVPAGWLAANNALSCSLPSTRP